MPYPQAVQLWGLSRQPLFKSSIPKSPEKSPNTLQPYSSSITCIFSFKYNLAVKLRIVSKEMGIHRATNLWFLNSQELLSSTRKAPTLRCCIAPGLPYHRGCHIQCRGGGKSTEAAESTMPLLSWHETKLEQQTLF